MYARVVTGRFQDTAMDRGIAVLEGEVRPHIATRAGFISWSLLIARETGRFQAITFWGSLVEANSASRDGFTDRAGMLRGLLAGELEQTLYEVRP